MALFLGVGLAATGLGLVAYGTNVFRELELQSVDARFSLRGTEKGQPYVLFMSNTTKEALTRPVDDLVFVDEFEVRGGQGTVKIWSVEAANVDALAGLAAKRERDPQPSGSAQP